MDLPAIEIITPRKRNRDENSITAKALKYFTKIEEPKTSANNQNNEIETPIEIDSPVCTPSKQVQKTHICDICNHCINGTKK